MKRAVLILLLLTGCGELPIPIDFDLDATLWGECSIDADCLDDEICHTIPPTDEHPDGFAACVRPCWSAADCDDGERCSPFVDDPSGELVCFE